MEKICFKVYKDASLNLDWTPKLHKFCKKVGIDFFTSPYSIELVDHVDRFVPAYKIGSGDITWLEIIKYISKKKKAGNSCYWRFYHARRETSC